MADSPTPTFRLGRVLTLFLAFGAIMVVGVGYLVMRGARLELTCTLCTAIDSGDPARVREVLATGVDVNLRVNSTSGTNQPFYHALNRLDPLASDSPKANAARAIVMMMLDAHADPNARFQCESSLVLRKSPSPSCSIYAAERVASARDLVVMRAMISHGLDPAGTGAGEALLAAASNGHTDIATLLIEHGIAMKYRNAALARAISERDRPMIAMLEKAGAKEWQP